VSVSEIYILNVSYSALAVTDSSKLYRSRWIDAHPSKDLLIISKPPSIIVQLVKLRTLSACTMAWKPDWSDCPVVPLHTGRHSTVNNGSVVVRTIRYDTIDDLHWKTDRQAACQFNLAHDNWFSISNRLWTETCNCWFVALRIVVFLFVSLLCFCITHLC